MVNLVDRRVLTVYAADAVEFPRVIYRFQELVVQDADWSEHARPTHELLWNEHGVSEVTVEARAWVISPARGLWMPAGVLHSGRAPAGTPFQHLTLRHWNGKLHPRCSGGVEVSPLLRLLLERLAETGLGDTSRHIAECAALDLMVPAGHEVFLYVPRTPLLQSIVEAFQEKPGSNVSLGRWAASLGVSPRTIARAFQAENGPGFAHWVAALRAYRAVGLLSGDDDLEGIAGFLGHGSISAFGAAFKRNSGFTPSVSRAR